MKQEPSGRRENAPGHPLTYPIRTLQAAFQGGGGVSEGHLRSAQGLAGATLGESFTSGLAAMLRPPGPPAGLGLALPLGAAGSPGPRGRCAGAQVHRGSALVTAPLSWTPSVHRGEDSAGSGLSGASRVPRWQRTASSQAAEGRVHCSPGH